MQHYSYHAWSPFFNTGVLAGTALPKTFNHEKSPMLKYGIMYKKISSRLVCGSHDTCLDCMLPGLEVTAGLGFFCVQVIYVTVKIVPPCFNRPSLLSRSLYWADNVLKIAKQALNDHSQYKIVVNFIART